MYLFEGKKGNTYLIEDILLNVDIRRRLYSLGLTNGTPIHILNSKKRGAIIVKVRGTRFALGRQLASGILIGGTV